MQHPSHQEPHGRPEQPRSEPEIIPPDRARTGRDDPEAGVFVYVDSEGRTRRVNVATPGPFTIILILLTIALVAATIFALVLGALFFLIPIAAVTLAALIAWFYARRFWQRLRGG